MRATCFARASIELPSSVMLIHPARARDTRTRRSALAARLVVLERDVEHGEAVRHEERAGRDLQQA